MVRLEAESIMLGRYPGDAGRHGCRRNARQTPVCCDSWRGFDRCVAGRTDVAIPNADCLLSLTAPTAGASPRCRRVMGPATVPERRR